MATTLSAVVLRGRRYLAHAGDSHLPAAGRAAGAAQHRPRGKPELKNVLSRAVGLDAHLSVDYADGELEAGDVFSRMSDGVWGQLGDRKIADILKRSRPQAAASRLAVTAEGGSQDNCTALCCGSTPCPPSACATTSPACASCPLPPASSPPDDG